MSRPGTGHECRRAWAAAPPLSGAELMMRKAVGRGLVDEEDGRGCEGECGPDMHRGSGPSDGPRRRLLLDPC